MTTDKREKNRYDFLSSSHLFDILGADRDAAQRYILVITGTMMGGRGFAQTLRPQGHHIDILCLKRAKLREF